MKKSQSVSEEEYHKFTETMLESKLFKFLKEFRKINLEIYIIQAKNSQKKSFFRFFTNENIRCLFHTWI